MKLVVATPLRTVLDTDDATYVEAEDATGRFGILPRHADFLTVLAVSVLTWRDRAGRDHHIAVRGGVLRVRGGERVEVATRQAVGEETLERLGEAVLVELRREVEEQAEARTAMARLELSLVRSLREYLEPARGRPPGAPPRVGSARE